MIALTNVLGELVERYRYTAFGLLTVLDAEGEEKDQAALSPWLYHGRLFEEASGLYWMRMRHYSPDLGRFLQPDPAGIAGGINLYAYSNNNPLRYFDPWGLWPAPDASGRDDGKYGEMNSSRYRRISRWIHGLLSAAGAVPVFGVIPDAVDLLYTLAELPSGHLSGSDVVLGAAAVVAVIVPVAGDGAAAAAKIANRALDAGEVIAKNAGDIKVIGRLDDTAVAKDWAGHDVLNIPDWTPKKNAQWVDDGIMNKQNFYTASPETGNMIQTSGPYKGQPTIYNMEIQQLNDAGYAKVGDYYVHPQWR